MSNICKTVTLRTRKIKKGTQLSFYLDYYPGYRDESTMKVQRHESLGIYIFAKPKNQREKDYNERMTEKAEALRCRRIRYNNVEKQRAGTEAEDVGVYFIALFFPLQSFSISFRRLNIGRLSACSQN